MPGKVTLGFSGAPKKSPPASPRKGSPAKKITKVV